MTKDEMITLLRSVNCDENTVTAMSNAYEMGFEQGAATSEGMKTLVEAAAETIKSFDAGGDPYTGKFWDAYNHLQGMV
jgi:hypothetical protein